jgi:hypothetical protein
MAYVIRSLIAHMKLDMKSNKLGSAVLYSFCGDKVNHTSREKLAGIIHQFM